MGFSRQESWSGLPFPSPGVFPIQGSKLDLLHCRQILYHLSDQEVFNYLITGNLYLLTSFIHFPSPLFFPILFFLIYCNWRLITLHYCGGFCRTFTWISHGCTCVLHADPPSQLPPHPIPQGHPSAPALSTLSHASNLDWRLVSHMIKYMFQCYSLRSSHPCLLPQSPKVCSLHLCLFCCLTYRITVTIFLNSIYMC